MFNVNEYFERKVASIAFNTAVQSATVGVMAPGEYEFGTSEFETMMVVSGALTVLLPEQQEWKTFTASEVFTIEANKKFKVTTTVDTAYLCTYGQ
jgi:uncharacterized protein YaiE (UPF0345 family)